MKNVLAIACGIVTGKGLGNSMRAMLLARGLAEAVDLGLALGARLETFLGLSGIGDIDLSCNSPQSRNMSLGMELGRGRTLAQVLRRAHHRAGRRALLERHRRAGRRGSASTCRSRGWSTGC